MGFYGLAMLVAFMLAFMLTPVVKQIAIKIKAVDAPNERKVHVKPMPRLGGLAIYLAFTITILVFYEFSKEIFGLIAGGTLITIIGVIDDKWGLAPRTKLLGQIVAATVLIFFEVKVGFLTNPFGWTTELGVLSIPVTILWVVGVTNAVNLIDGLDGLAAGISSISAIILGVVALLGGNQAFALAMFILAASSLGFLKYNFHPAQIFMGDSGSMFLGFNLAALAMLGLTKSITVVSLFIPILIIGVPILDTFFAIVRRFKNKTPIFSPDKDHLHHRLLALGFSHTKSVLVMYGVAVFLGLSAIGIHLVTSAQATALIVMLAIFLLICAERVGVLGIKPKQDNINSSAMQRHEEL